MAAANPLWGSPRIHGEFLKLGLAISGSTVSRLMPKRRPQPSQTWRTFLANHVRDLVALDFFTVPTAGLRVLFVLIVLAHHRRSVVHFNVTEHPTAAWTAQQLVEAFPDDSAPPYLLRDRDSTYGHTFRHRVSGMGIREVLTAPQRPWQNPFAEHLVGSIRRDCLDNVLVLGERHLRRILTAHFAYAHRTRIHLALDKDAPDLRPIALPAAGKIVQLPRPSAPLNRRGWSSILRVCSRFIHGESGRVDHAARSGSEDLIAVSQPRLAAVVAAGGVVALRESVTPALAVAGALMGLGVWLHVSERHAHEHAHEALEHQHLHRHDAHHQHEHAPGVPLGEPHAHRHVHARLTHSHPHCPDIHHRHDH